MMDNLVIVESPTKARTLQRFLGNQYQIEASFGHVRDLPKADLGVDVEHNFEPQYIIPRDKRKKVNELKKLAKEAKTIWLASDPDREGEAIAWHLGEVVSDQGKGKKEFKRVVFHEITEEAIKEAFKHPRGIDFKLVDAQQARRVLDRLVGYKLSPLLWQKVKRGLSAGRVQSVALRLIVEREREIEKFKPVEYWEIEVELENGQKNTFVAQLIERHGKKLEIKNEKEAREHEQNLQKASYSVSKITQKEVHRFPYPPFTTSTLQQTAANRLGFSAKKTMMLAQTLYEHGLITYMRTDSVNLSIPAVSSARDYISKSFGKEYLPKTARGFKAKSKNAQEAHEAIRPTDVKKLSASLKQGDLNRDHARLYDLIWKRLVACQMSEAVMDQTSVDVSALPAGPAGSPSPAYLLRASGSIVKFDGWLKLYGKSQDDEEKETDEKILPELKEGENLNLLKITPSQHFTEPPARFSEAALIKKLEELGIGRPSTYAPILSTLTERFYVERVERRFIPTALGFAVTDFLVKYFSDIVDYSFTAKMEDSLDEISRGETRWQPIMADFYTPFEKKIEEVGKVAEKVTMKIELAGKTCPECGKDLIVKIGRFGKFLACAGFPDCKHTQSLEEKINAQCPLDNGEIVVRHTKRGKTFYGCKNWPVCKFASWTKPKAEKENSTS